MNSRSLLCAGALCLGSLAPIAAQETTVAGTPSVASFLPADTVLYVAVKDVARLNSKLAETPFYKNRETNGLGPLLDEFESKWKEIERQTAEEVDIDITALTKACEGEVALVVGDLSSLTDSLKQAFSSLEEPEIGASSVPVLVTVDTRGGQEAFQKQFDKLLAYARGEGVPVETETLHGGKLTTVSRPPEETQGPEHVYVAQHDSRWFLGLDKDYLGRVLSSADSDGEGGSLAASASWKAITGHTGSDSDLMAYVNAQALTEAADSVLGTSMFAFFWQKFRTLFIGQSLRAFGGSASLSAGGLSQKFFFHNEGADDGFLGWFKASPIPARPSPLIPGDAKNFSSMAIDGSKLLGTLREVAQTAMAFQPATSGGDIDQFFQAQFGMSFGELERSIGDRVHTFMVEGASLQNPAGSDLSLVFELDDAQPWKALVERLAVMSGGSLAAEKYLGRDLYALSAGPQMQPALAVTDKLFLFSVSRKNVEKVIRRIGEDESEIADSEGFKELADKLPSELVSLSYTRSDFVKSYLQLIATAMSAGTAGSVPDSVLEALRGFGTSFGSSIGWSRWEDEGLYSESWTAFQD